MNFRIFFPLALVLCIATTSLALSPSVDYDQGPVPFDEYGSLYYSIDLSAGIVQLALHVKDDEDIAMDSLNWLGLGVSEPTSGSMLGADVVTAEFSVSQTDNCTMTDRYVPFAAYPLIEGGASPSVYPVEDDCQNDGSWVLVRCARKGGEMVLEVRRTIDAHDDQDREIVEGINSMIYAYGGAFRYHDRQRGAMQVVFFEDGIDDNDGPIAAEPAIPGDVDGSIELRASEYVVPTKQTTYACTSQKFELGAEESMIVAVEPIIDSEIDMVHHFTLFLCSGEEYAQKTVSTVACSGEEAVVEGPLDAKGGKRYVTPKEAGFLVTKKSSFLVMETHFDNAGAVKGNKDSSGVRIHYTSKMREHRAGSLLVGDSLVTRFGEKVKSQFEYEHSCPTNCTEKFSQDINIFGSFLHMHTTGQDIYTNRFAANGSFVDTLNKVNFWSDAFQRYVMFDPPYVMKPGEQLQTTCVYDTSKRPDTVFGIATQDEMCMNFIAYWPMQRDPETGDEMNVCSFFKDDDGATYTVCGDISSPQLDVIEERNPSIEDEVGASTTFGDSQDTCTPPAQALAPSPSPSITGEDNSEAAQENGDGDENDDNADDNDNVDDNDNACFPGSASVDLEDGRAKRMDELVIGDRVQVGAKEFSEVFMFTHNLVLPRFRFRKLDMKSGRSLHLTSGHYLYVNNKLQMAKSVKVGDSVTLASGDADLVTRVSSEIDTGLFNPQTVNGNIVVNGILASTYTESLVPTCAHGLLAPLRWAYGFFGTDFSIV